MIETIIFDIGDVLMCGGHKEAFKNNPELKDNEYRAWQEFKVGKCSEREYWEKVVRGTKYESEAERMMLETRAIFLNPRKGPAYEAALMARENGYDLAIISNHATVWARPALEVLGLDKVFSGFPVIISEEVGMKKPDRDIYEHTLNLVKSPAGRCVFIDDQEPNVMTAKELGMYAILCGSKEQVKKELKELGVFT